MAKWFFSMFSGSSRLESYISVIVGIVSKSSASGCVSGISYARTKWNLFCRVVPFVVSTNYDRGSMDLAATVPYSRLSAIQTGCPRSRVLSSQALWRLSKFVFSCNFCSAICDFIPRKRFRLGSVVPILRLFRSPAGLKPDFVLEELCASNDLYGSTPF